MAKRGFLKKTVLGGMLVFCVLFSVFAPWVRAASYFVDPALPLYQMSDRQKEIVSQLKLFDRTYQRLSEEAISVPSIWHYLAEDVFGTYVDMSCKGDAQSDAPFVLRGMLASGICYLYESQALMAEGPDSQSQALKAYDDGLEILEKVIRIGKKNPAIDYLPNYSIALRTNAGKDTFFMHPLAGCETILVGMDAFPMQSAFTRDLIVNVPLQTMHTALFVPLENYRKRLQGWYGRCSSEKMFNEARETQFKQGSTDATARFFLSEFCPWGLGVYRTLRDAGLIRGLDWRILRPFAGEHPQDMSELSITKSFLIPNHILGELNQMVGNGKAGFLDSGRETPVEWAWVSQPPTYTIKYVSPLVYERVRADEQFSTAMGYVKMVFGGPVDFAMDAIFGKLLDEVEHYYGKDNDIYRASWVVFHGNDKGFITTDFAEKRQLSGTTLFKKLAGAAFAALEDKMVADMYEGIDPRSVALGKSYNGQPIPPIMIRGDVLGFQKIPAVEYGRTIQAVRHYLLRPAAIACKAPRLPYNPSKNEGLDALRKEDYLKEQWANDPKKSEVIRKNAWEQLPTPFGSREYITDFSPAYQIFNMNLPKKEFKQWTESLPKKGNSEKTLLHVQLWQESADEANRLIVNERIHDPAVRLVVYNVHSPEGKSAFISADGKYSGATHKLKIGNKPMHPATYRYFGPSDHRLQKVESLALELKSRLQSRYRVVVTLGKNGRELAEYPLVIAPGRGEERARVTGTLSVLTGGGVALKANLSQSGVYNMPIPIKPVYTDVLPPRLTINRTLPYSRMKESGRLHLDMESYDDATISGTLSGFPLRKGYHKITVSLADRKYIMWAQVRHPYMAAHVAGHIAVPPGNHEVTLSCPGVRSYRFIVARPVPSSSSEKLLQAQQSYQRALAEYRKKRTQSNAESVGFYAAKLGEKLHNHGREKEALEYFLQAKELNPERLRTSGLNVSAFYDTAFHLGDIDNLLWAGLAYIEDYGWGGGKEAREAYQESGRGHEEVQRHARDASWKYTELIQRWIALGGSAKVARQLNQRILEFWSMAGFDPEDSGAFPSSIQGASVCFGPDKHSEEQ